MKKTVGYILAALLVVSLAGNVYQYTQLQAMQAQMTASTAKIDELSAKLTEQSALLEKLTLEKKQLNDELAARAGLIKNLNDTISMQELALDTSIPTPDQLLGDVGDPSGSTGSSTATPTPEVVKPAPVPPTPPAPQKPAETPKPAPPAPQKPESVKPPVNNNASSGNTQLSPEEIDRLMKEYGVSGGGGSGTQVNPDAAGSIKPHGE